MMVCQILTLCKAGKWTILLFCFSPTLKTFKSNKIVYEIAVYTTVLTASHMTTTQHI